MGIITLFDNFFPMPLRGMADSDSSSVIATLVDEPGFEVCACQRCEFEEYAFVKNNGSYWMNSKKRFIRAKRFPTDTIEFTLWKDGVQRAVLNDNTYGVFYNFGSTDLINPDYKAFIVDWNLVQLGFGYGKYSVKTVHTSLGTPRTFESWKFNVVEYTPERANGTVRIETYQNGSLTNGFDYTGLFIYQSLWIKGFFGDKKPKYQEKNYQDPDFKKHQIKAEMQYTYKLSTEKPLPAAVYNILNNDDILANDIYITDYNVLNQEVYKRKNVYLSDIIEVENHKFTRVSSFVYEFTDKIENINKRNISGDFGSMPLQPNTTTTISCADAHLEVNSDPFTDIPSGATYNLVVKDTNGDPVGEKIGTEWIVEAVPDPSGVLLRWPLGYQYTSYRTGDEGWRVQNGYFDYTPPVYPKVIAQIDRSIGQNGWLRLLENLQVGANSNKLRFVDVDGLQVWGATGNKDKITIDKLTGIGLYRVQADIDPVATWNNAVDNGLTLSVTVDGIVYDDFYLVSMEELQALFYHKSEQASGHIEDLISAGQPDIYSQVASGTESWTSTTQANSAGANAYSVGRNPEAYVRGVAKSANFYPFYVFDARSLITAP